MKDLEYFGSRDVINKIDLSQYITNPKVICLRILFIFRKLESEFDEEVAKDVLYLVAKKANLTQNYVDSILINIKKCVRSDGWNKLAYRQQLLFANKVYGISENRTFSVYLKLNRTVLYNRTSSYKINTFLSPSWLRDHIDGLDLFNSSVLEVMKPAFINYLKQLTDFCEVLGGI